MSSSKTFSEKTNAADKSIGFEYQYYYFLYRLLNLKKGQSVGLEILDDVHTTLNANLQILFQLKHTTQQNASNKPINLTQLDVDLWKTLYTWAAIITDKQAHRDSKLAQLDFLKKTEFHLVTNKSASAANNILSKILSHREENSDYATLEQAIRALRAATVDAQLGIYIDFILALDPNIADIFFKKIHFELGLDDIIAKIHQSILEKAIDEDQINTVFERLDSNIRSDNFISIKAGHPIAITFDDFMLKYRKIFTTSRSKNLRHIKYKPQLPTDLFSQKFVSHLLYIGDVKMNEVDIIAEYTTERLRLANSLLEWRASGQLVSDEIQLFHDDVKHQWRNRFRSAFRKLNSQQSPPEEANILLDTLRADRFRIAGEELNTDLSNGELYHLSELDEIGWYPNWEQ